MKSASMSPVTGRRIIFLLLFMTMCLLLLIGLLGYIQLFSKTNYQGVNLVSSSINQRSRSVVLDVGRGDILDRYGRSLTGKTESSLLILPRDSMTFVEETGQYGRLADILQVDETQLIDRISAVKYPQLLEINRTVLQLDQEQKRQVGDLQISGLFVVEHKQRYTDASPAKHVVGFIGEDYETIQKKYGRFLEAGVFSATDLIGKSGLEAMYELELRSEGATQISYYVYQDRNLQLHPYYGLGLQYQKSSNQHRPANVITTLDYDIQEFVEKNMQNYGIKQGSIVVLDVVNGDILAMASAPDYNQQAIDMEQFHATRNRAVTANFPGSVFKTVIAAAVLEERIVTNSDLFTCEGKLEFAGGQVLHCWKEHGTMNFTEAFADSCNVVFAQLAIGLGRDKIVQYADALGVYDKAGYYDKVLARGQLYQEEAGSVFQVEGANGQLLANTGIGQQDVKMTPLQAANLMATIANLGERHESRIVTEIRGKNGHSIRKFPEQSSNVEISRHTIYRLQKLLEAVTTTGTGKDIAAAGISAAGKTGTAELGNGGRVHRWFTGYFPAKYPKYAVTVMVEDVASYEHVSTPVNMFIDIAKELTAE